MIDMKKIIAVVIIVLTGCSGIPKPNTASWDPAPRDQSKGEFWNPTAEEKSRAVSLGRWFANKHLGLSKNDIEKMRTDFTGWFRNDRTILWIQFYDPEIHQPLPSGGFEAKSGGFPTYFTVSVDVENWIVVDHYASPE
jgi:hypothetical protein